MRLHFVRRLDPVVEVLEEEGEPERERPAAEEREQQIRGRVRTRRSARHFGGIHDADVAGLQLGAHARFLRALQQALEDLPVGRVVALQRAVVDSLAAQRQRVTLLLVERARQRLLLDERCLVFVPHRLDDFRDFSLQLALGELDRVRDLQHVRVARPELLGELCLLTLQLGDLPLLLLDERVREDGRERVEGVAIVLQPAKLVVRRFLLDAFGLRPRHRRVQIRQLLDDDVLLVFERDGVGLLAVALQGLLARFNLFALFAQPLA